MRLSLLLLASVADSDHSDQIRWIRVISLNLVALKHEFVHLGKAVFGCCLSLYTLFKDKLIRFREKFLQVYFSGKFAQLFEWCTARPESFLISI